MQKQIQTKRETRQNMQREAMKKLSKIMENFLVKFGLAEYSLG